MADVSGRADEGALVDRWTERVLPVSIPEELAGGLSTHGGAGCSRGCPSTKHPRNGDSAVGVSALHRGPHAETLSVVDARGPAVWTSTWSPGRGPCFPLRLPPPQPPNETADGEERGESLLATFIFSDNRETTERGNVKTENDVNVDNCKKTPKPPNVFNRVNQNLQYLALQNVYNKNVQQKSRMLLHLQCF